MLAYNHGASDSLSVRFIEDEMALKQVFLSVSLDFLVPAILAPLLPAYLLYPTGTLQL
jgi:hypothetical protein